MSKTDDEVAADFEAITAQFQHLTRFDRPKKRDEVIRQIAELESYARRSKAQDDLLSGYNMQLVTLEDMISKDDIRRAQVLESWRASGSKVEGPIGSDLNQRTTVDSWASRGPIGELRDNARRTLDVVPLPDDARDHLTRAMERVEGQTDSRELTAMSRWLTATGDPAYSRAVAKMFRDPQDGHREFTGEELEAYRTSREVQRAMAIGTDTTGGFLLPTHLEPSIMLTNASVVDPVRQYARQATIATNTWHGISSAGVSASWDPEATQVSDDSPAVASPGVPTYKRAAFVIASIEAAMDTTIGQQVAELFVDAFARLEGVAFTTGSGTDEPTGFVTALAGSASEINSAGSEALIRADLFTLQEALPARWRPNARFMANLSTINDVREFPRLTSGTEVPLVDDSTTPPKVLGWQLVENSSMDGSINAAATANNYVVAVGDWKQYLVVDRIGTTVEYVQHIFGNAGRPTGQRGWYAYGRTGGDVLIDDAFRLLDVPTTA